MKTGEPLVYPPHYPPTDRWQRFFLGVRWLGPDLSFFKRLAAQQKIRTSDLLDQWGGGARQQVATEVSAVFARKLRWSSKIFLPHDSVAVIAGGPRLGFIDGDVDVAEAIAAIEAQLGITMAESFWQNAGSHTLGEIVDQLLAAGAVPA